MYRLTRSPISLPLEYILLLLQSPPFLALLYMLFRDVWIHHSLQYGFLITIIVIIKEIIGTDSNGLCKEDLFTGKFTFIVVVKSLWTQIIHKGIMIQRRPANKFSGCKDNLLILRGWKHNLPVKLWRWFCHWDGKCNLLIFSSMDRMERQSSHLERMETQFICEDNFVIEMESAICWFSPSNENENKVIYSEN